jgi:hypothetical protein
MAARKEVIQTVIWHDRREHSDYHSVLEGDWRDPSISVYIEGARMVAGDEHWRGHEAGTAVEPDWGFGCWLEAPDRQQTHLIEFSGHPGKIFADALLKGLVGKGVIVFQDDQRHGR